MEPVPYIAAFLGGLLAFFSPCVIPLIPAYISLVSGVSLNEMTTVREEKWRIRKVLLINSGLFSLGFTFVFVLLGAGASFLGKFLIAQLEVLSRIAGIVIVILGLHISGLFRIKFLYYEKRFHLNRKPVGVGWSFLAGMAFAFGWTPCIGPILAGILVYAATKETMDQGILLLMVFSLGMAMPFMATALLFDLVRKVPLTSSILRRFEVVSGSFLVVIGVLIFSNEFQSLASIFTSGLGGLMEWVSRFEESILQW